MSSTDVYPRLETIVVPDNVRPECIGIYVSDRARVFLDGIGKSSFNSRAVTLKPLSLRIYTLSFFTATPPTLQKDADIYEKEEEVQREEEVLDVRGVDAPELPQVGSQAVAVRNKKGFVTPQPLRATD